MTEPAGGIHTKTTLVDITKCIGCRACQVACKHWNEGEGEATELEYNLGFQNPATLSAKTLTLITFHELPNEQAQGGLNYLFTMRRCLHCLEPACTSACPTTALARMADGPVGYDADKCIGCRYCVWACPWGVPTPEWDSLTPKIKKCTHCADREDQPVPLERNSVPLTADETDRYKKSITTPACVKACPADALTFGDRDSILQDAHARIAAHPDKYVDHIYGEKEAGGTTVVYLSSVPFEKIGFPDVGTKPYPGFSRTALHAVPPAVIAVGAMLGGVYSFMKRRTVALIAAAENNSALASKPKFAPLDAPLLTPFNWGLLALMAFGVISLITRFVLGLGGSTHLSNTYPWGLWIVFDLVWIAVAAGAFATAGIIYVFQRKDLYSLGRSAVLMGLLSYSFVTVTLIADLGLPWNSYQLALQSPEQSAMFEVSWCVGLYVTILLLEFLPVPFERWGLARAMAIWQKWSGAYVAGAVTLFVFLLSRNYVYAALAAVVFSALAWLFRAKDKKPEPIILAIAAVTLSTMHQSSLGSLFLLMPDKLAPQWWSPVMPISFFLSSIAAGTGLVIVIEMWIARGWNRPTPMRQLAAMGQITFWSLLVYAIFRLADMGVRGQFAGAFGGTMGALFIAELVVGFVIPLALLARQSSRMLPRTLFLGASLTTAGVVFNRINVVYFAMHVKGAMPQVAPEHYAPSIFEWGISVGLIATTIFLFGLGVRLMPVLPAKETIQGD
ncbi:4Fe-4S ferredoxin, iron-sulfur binding protein [Candidatus Koribacter versatilis Ellin345]|uniref:4Fe-4S ferredoxin, iron-sulfur binding protein n=1 Tax=Koribacter versatilis (strain Ellin345) TaxID=204669 RepID=Q1IUJ0_KORVE|nr:4Fe-4S dicluster domain-containing protein [Candidatus Koribacter versatilis]ABF39460.1 4Fe-4S ferredoxin, iron-sulfur binding protein [Candidatus Koribacter versatilis Ellin345]